MKRLLLALLASLTLVAAASAQSLVGTYRLESFRADYDDGTSVDFFGKQPNGYLVITPQRLMVLIVATDRKPGATSEDKAALFNTVISYTGPYSLDGARLVTDVDVSWNQSWTGSKQARTWSIEGNRLTLQTDKAPSLRDPSKMATARLVWIRTE